MSLLWLRNYQLDDPNNPDTANVPFLMGDKSKGVLFGSDYCMCARWGIFTLCPCNIWGQVWGDTQIGQGGGYLTFPSFIPGTESPEHPEGIPHPYAGRPAYLDINGNRVPALWIRIESGNVGAFNGFLPPIAVQSYGVLTTVKHQTGEAPFKCTISAELWEEGPLGEQNTPVRRKIAEVTDIPCEAGKRVYLGQSSYWDSNQSDAGEEITDAWRIPVSKQCLHYEETCVARLDLTVTYTPIGDWDSNQSDAGEEITDACGTPKKYSVRTPVLVIDLGADAEMGRAFVLPDIFPDEACVMRGSIGDANMPMTVRQLKGPFRSKADALEVYTAHKAKIDAYAKRCACPPSGCNMSYDCIGYHWIDDQKNELGYYDLIEAGGKNDPRPWAGCDAWPIKYECGKGSQIIIIKTDALGNRSEAPASGVLMPGEYIRGYALSPPDPSWPDSDPPWEIDPNFVFSGDYDYATEPNLPPCPFCEDPDDLDAPEDCVWSFSEWDAIPNNSQELEEQMGGQP